eukprot:TRINITY_DN3322_c0_g2_i11.p1 TRINITY_DN3322_c0_g2~~TRINITY_DN3322_c0_g2_i11.p1  ORF type:complete len:444 (-),score=76.59 TRINITY_DN3322_c0_g2_i11:28-1359(-)
MNPGPSTTTSAIISGSDKFLGCSDIDECLLYGCADEQPTQCYGSDSTTVVMLGKRICECPEGWKAVQDKANRRNFTLVGDAPFGGCATVCGDSLIKGEESCDDGNTADGDGCSADCKVEIGWTCLEPGDLCTPICGDSLTAGSESCDDGNTDSGDGCDSNCVVETGFVCSDPGYACCTELEEWMKEEKFVCRDSWWVSDSIVTSPDISFKTREVVDISRSLKLCGHFRITQPLTIWDGILKVAGSVEITNTGSLIFESKKDNTHGRLDLIESCPLPVMHPEDAQLKMLEGSTIAIHHFHWQHPEDTKADDPWLDDAYMTLSQCPKTTLGNLYLNATAIPKRRSSFNFATFSDTCISETKDSFFQTDSDLPGGCSEFYQNFTKTGSIHVGLNFRDLCEGEVAAIGAVAGTAGLLGLIGLVAIGVRVGLGAGTVLTEDTNDYEAL